MTVRYSKVIETADWSVTPYKKEVRADVEEFQGVTLKVGNQHTQVMSDVWELETYALVWDVEAGKPTIISWINGGDADATDEVKAKYREYLIQRKTEQILNTRNNDAHAIVKDCTVEVISGRTGKGTVGKVAVIIERPYNTGYKARYENKLAIALDDETEEVPTSNGKVYTRFKNVIWVWARNCKRLDVATPDVAEARKNAEDSVDYDLKFNRA